MDLLVSPPCELPLGIVARALLDECGCRGNIAAVCQCVHKFFIADGLHGRGRGGDAGGKKSANLIEQPRFQHFFDAKIDPIV